jgi:tetraacyldisaccharide 4'-kinase
MEPDLPDDFPTAQKFFAFAGIGRPEKFYETCRKAGLNLVDTQDFPDHYFFSNEELAALQKQALAHSAQLLTTEKDWVRLPPGFQAKVTALPVKLVFDNPESILRLLVNRLQ